MTVSDAEALGDFSKSTTFGAGRRARHSQSSTGDREEPALEPDSRRSMP